MIDVLLFVLSVSAVSAHSRSSWRGNPSLEYTGGIERHLLIDGEKMPERHWGYGTQCAFGAAAVRCWWNLRW